MVLKSKRVMLFQFQFPSRSSAGLKWWIFIATCSHCCAHCPQQFTISTFCCNKITFKAYYTGLGTKKKISASLIPDAEILFLELMIFSTWKTFLGKVNEGSFFNEGSLTRNNSRTHFGLTKAHFNTFVKEWYRVSKSGRINTQIPQLG